MKALVTGASGFIGNALCDALRARGDDVVAAVRTGEPRANVIMTGDINANTDWSAAVRDVEVVFHLAAHVHVLDAHAARDLEKFREVNVGGSESLARAAIAAGVRRFVFMSTVATSETAYGKSKAEAEERLRELCRGTSTQLTIMRAPLVYGPGVEAKFLQLLSIMRRGIPLPFASVKNRRSMIYIDNLTDALLVAATSPAAANETFFVADDEAWSTPELIRELASAMHRSPRLIPLPVALLKLAGKRVEPLITSMEVDSSKFRRLTGWGPPHSARDGLRRTVSHTPPSSRA